jgi:hypothetical protein
MCYGVFVFVHSTSFPSNFGLTSDCLLRYLRKMPNQVIFLVMDLDVSNDPPTFIMTTNIETIEEGYQIWYYRTKVSKVCI